MYSFILLLSCLIVPAFSWGAIGHQAVARVATPQLSSSSQNYVANLLSHQTMESVSTWADTIRSQRPWSDQFHYINVKFNTTYNGSPSCGTLSGSCIYTALLNYTTRINDHSLPVSEQNEALKYLIHFVGDLHQPLHIGFDLDNGGTLTDGLSYLNSKKGTKVGLHEVWDSVLIAYRIKTKFKNYENWITYLDTLPSSPINCTDFTSCIIQWATESSSLCSIGSVYHNDDGSLFEPKDHFVVAENYYNLNILVIESRLINAAARLAHVINLLSSSNVTSVTQFFTPSNIIESDYSRSYIIIIKVIFVAIVTFAVFIFCSFLSCCLIAAQDIPESTSLYTYNWKTDPTTTENLYVRDTEIASIV